MSDSILVYTDYREHIDPLSYEERGRLFTAILDYAKTGQTEDLEQGVKIAFSFIKSQIERDKLKYDAICERNRTNGSKGGRPPKNPNHDEDGIKPDKPSGLSGLLPETHEKHNDNDTDPDNDTEHDVYVDANASCPASQTSEPPTTALIVPEKAKTSATAKARSETINEIVTFLNLTLGTSYQPSGTKTREKITARLNEGFTLDDFKTVICKKSAEWGGDPAMSKYLRPETLFGTKFEGYLNQPDRPPKPRNPYFSMLEDSL